MKYKLLITNICDALGFNWINKSTWKYTGYYDKNIILSFKRHNWDIETVSIFSIDNLKKIHGTENLYYHESEVKRYIRCFCKKNNLCWINSKIWKFSNKKDKTIELMCHNCGHKFSLSFRQMLEREKGCMFCFAKNLRINENEIKSLIEKAEIELSCECINKNEKYINKKKTKFKFLVDLDLYKKITIIWETNLDNLKVILKNRKTAKNKFYVFLKDHQIKDILNEFINDTKIKINYTGNLNLNTELECICPTCGEKCYIKTSDLLYGKKKIKCKCSTLYAGEAAIKDFLEKNNINFEFQKTFDWLKYKKPLKLDFFLPEYNIGIEYQGEQHFKPVKYFGGQEIYSILISRDKIKNKLCKEHGIKILYISDKTLFNKYSNNYVLGKLIYNLDKLLDEIKKSNIIL